MILVNYSISYIKYIIDIYIIYTFFITFVNEIVSYILENRFITEDTIQLIY